MFVWDEKKRRSNLEKHKLDFVDAALVYDDPGKVTFASIRHEEERYVDIAILEVADLCLALIYIERGPDIRIISFRPASKKERERYHAARQPD